MTFSTSYSCQVPGTQVADSPTFQLPRQGGCAQKAGLFLTRDCAPTVCCKTKLPAPARIYRLFSRLELTNSHPSPLCSVPHGRHWWHWKWSNKLSKIKVGGKQFTESALHFVVTYWSDCEAQQTAPCQTRQQRAPSMVIPTRLHHHPALSYREDTCVGMSFFKAHVKPLTSPWHSEQYFTCKARVWGSIRITWSS